MKKPSARPRRAFTRDAASTPVKQVRKSSAARAAGRTTSVVDRSGDYDTDDDASAQTRERSGRAASLKNASVKKASVTKTSVTETPAKKTRAKKASIRNASAKNASAKNASGRNAAAKQTPATTPARKRAAPRVEKDTPDQRPRTDKHSAGHAGTPAGKRPPAEGWHGWDEYAAFYDWENARTVGRRDIRFWGDVAQRTGGRSLELGCGTGRILTPLAGLGLDIVGIDRSAPMLARAEARVKRLRRRAEQAAASAAVPAVSASLLRGDIRQLPFAPGSFDLVMAPYGILQSLVRERDLSETLRAVFAALAPGGRFGLDLVPDVPRWQEYARRVSMRGRRGPRGVPVTLVESVRQDRAKGLTIFDQEFIEGRGKARRVHRFSLTFRTVSIQSLRHRLERAGFVIDAVLGGYDGRPWDPRADTWVLMASKPA